MNQPVVSIVVPVYNVEKYLPECLDSLINQTYRNLEILCVNDGATDGSRRVLAGYAEKDKRIRVLDRENGGLSAARNTGLDQAVGEYIIFIDSDDWCHLEMIEKMVALAEKNKTDFVNCAAQLYDEKKQLFSEADYFSLEMLSDDFEKKVLTLKEIWPQLFSFNVTVWSKLFRRSFLVECDLRFKEGILHEDEYFWVDLCFRMKTFCFTKEKLYFYRINRVGAITSNPMRGKDDYLKTLAKWIQVLKQEKVWTEKGQEFWDYVFQIFRDTLARLSEDEKELFFQKCKKFVLQNPVDEIFLKKSCILEEHVCFFRNDSLGSSSIKRTLLVWKVKEKSKKGYFLGIPVIKIFANGKRFILGVQWGGEE